MGGTTAVSGPDLAEGISVDNLSDGRPFVGHVGDEGVLLVRRGDRIDAIGASCTHYGAPLADGLVVGDEIRCPWHHACFSLSTGEATRAPAFAPIACWDVEREGSLVRVRQKKETQPARAAGAGPSSVVIVGAGAAGAAAAEMLRRRGYGGPITMIGADTDDPVDRPNLSKDYLAGNAPEEWIPLAVPDSVTRVRGRATKVDVAAKQVATAEGGTYPYGALLLATGAEAIRLPIPGADAPHVHVLRALADSRAIIGLIQRGAKRAVVIGASFIGLEVAASLRARGIDVHVVAPEARPLERVLGAELGDFIRGVHEGRGVVFHLGRKPTSIDGSAVMLDDGTRLPADLVVMGVGVRPSLALAEAAGLAVDRGIVVDETMATSAPHVWAAGDAARYPYRGESVRIEHWVVAQRMGQVAAENMLGRKTPLRAAPFFWSVHDNVTIGYVGNAVAWDRLEIDGDLAKRDAAVRYIRGGHVVAVATINRDLANLQAEVVMETPV